ncbi:trypsin-like serine protease [candidate division WOR-3 bacterium]|nr:trypsin-like serine protease [candidate division WOR-3 bacterium]
MKSLAFRIVLLVGLIFPVSCGALPQAPTGNQKVSPATVQEDVTRSRVNAIVVAARNVSPAVVSVVVTQTRVVSYEPFDIFGFDDFFRDFFPRHTFRQEIKSMGSGVIVDQKGYIVTNAHVVTNATRIKVTLPDNRSFDAELVALDPDRDLALLKIPGENLPVATLGNSDELMTGEWAIAIGNPFGFLIEDAQPTVTVGVISALHRDIKSGRGDAVYTDMIQTDAAINPGNSGGPLVNALGEVIGINTFIFSHAGGSEGVGFARPINEVKRFINEALGQASADYEKFSTKIGAVVADINPALRTRFGIAHKKGVVVVEVKGNSIAEKIGLMPGDVILLSNGKVVDGARTFKERLERRLNFIDLVIDRKGEQLRVLYQLQ